MTRKLVLMLEEGISFDGVIQRVRQSDGTGIVQAASVVTEPVLSSICEHGPGATRKHTPASSRHPPQLAAKYLPALLRGALP